MFNPADTAAIVRTHRNLRRTGDYQPMDCETSIGYVVVGYNGDVWTTNGDGMTVRQVATVKAGKVIPV